MRRRVAGVERKRKTDNTICSKEKASLKHMTKSCDSCETDKVDKGR